MGLECLNENLNEISCDMVFSNQLIEFRPSLEKLKQRYYNQISRFISLPQMFEGVGGNV
jgi:dynein heavy chain 2